MALSLARQPCFECKQPTGHLCAYCVRAICWGCWSAGHDCDKPVSTGNLPTGRRGP